MSQFDVNSAFAETVRTIYRPYNRSIVILSHREDSDYLASILSPDSLKYTLTADVAGLWKIQIPNVSARQIESETRRLIAAMEAYMSIADERDDVSNGHNL